jgi:hypothetical protein
MYNTLNHYYINKKLKITYIELDRPNEIHVDYYNIRRKSVKYIEPNMYLSVELLDKFYKSQLVSTFEPVLIYSNGVFVYIPNIAEHNKMKIENEEHIRSYYSKYIKDWYFNFDDDEYLYGIHKLDIRIKVLDVWLVEDKDGLF